MRYYGMQIGEKRTSRADIGHFIRGDSTPKLDKVKAICNLYTEDLQYSHVIRADVIACHRSAARHTVVSVAKLS